MVAERGLVGFVARKDGAMITAPVLSEPFLQPC